MTKVNVAVMGPRDTIAPNGVYVEVRDSWGDKAWTQGTGGSGKQISKLSLINRGAQFHTVEVPAWVSPTDQAIADLGKVADSLYWDSPAQCGDIRDAIAKIKSER